MPYLLGKPPSMGDVKIAIIGAGLSGLVAAWQLDQQGRKDWRLFEARDRIGGRILSPEVLSPTREHSQARPANRLDLGPSWFWPEFQPQLAQLVQALGLQAYRSIRLTHSCLNRNKADFLLRRGRFRSALASEASAFLSTG